MTRHAVVASATMALTSCAAGWQYEAVKAGPIATSGCAPVSLSAPEDCIGCDLELIGVLSYEGDAYNRRTVFLEAERRGADYITAGQASGGHVQHNTLILSSTTVTHQVRTAVTLRWLFFVHTRYPNHRADPSARPPWLNQQMTCPAGQVLHCSALERAQWCGPLDHPSPSAQGRRIEWHSNGRKAADLQYLDGRLNNVARFWWPNDQLKGLYRYHERELCGPQQCWNEDGTAAAKCAQPKRPTCPAQ